MEMTSCWTAIRTERALSAAHVGTTALASRTRLAATKQINGLSTPVVGFVGVPAYTADQESHPPRGNPPV
ncbi:MAG TPA: hypothetical protein VNQ77_02820 [Frankiaceae bacterium]|nr:hypothetical protein [Frankiaceae bacterium]